MIDPARALTEIYCVHAAATTQEGWVILDEASYCMPVWPVRCFYGPPCHGDKFVYYNLKIIVCRLLDADRQQYIYIFKLLDIDKCPYEISRSAWMDDLVATQNGIDSIFLANNVAVILYCYITCILELHNSSAPRSLNCV